MIRIYRRSRLRKYSVPGGAACSLDTPGWKHVPVLAADAETLGRILPSTSPMRFSRRLALLLILSALLSTSGLFGSGVVLKPSGRLLFQPQLLWSNSMTTLQGTGYIITHAGKYFGVTSIHFMDFDAGGLRSATWLDVYSESPLATFRSSHGRPLRSTITQPRHVADDFLLLPCSTLPDSSTALELENIERYTAGTRLWFPNKNREIETGHEWVDATVVEDLGYLIKVRLRDPVTLDSQSGSPLLSADTGKVIGMLQSGEEENGKILLTLCPARSIVKFLSRPQRPTPLLTSISRRR